MKIINQDNIFDILEKIVGQKVEEDDNKVIFQIERMGHKINVVVEKNKIFDLIANLDEYSFVDASLYKKNEYCVAVKSNYGFFRLSDDFNVNDDENAIKYSINSISLKYYLAMIDSLLDEDNNPEKISLKKTGIGMVLTRHFAEMSEKDFVSLEEILGYFYRIKTINIESSHDKKLEEYYDLVSSYVFSISYNYNVVLVPYRNALDVYPKRIMRKINRNSVVKSRDEFDPPRRRYNNELVNHYQMALVSESPYLEFLSYYHIIEHFFDSVVNDDLVETIKRQITMPSFSYKRKKDILELVKTINKVTQVRNETTVYNESTALKLALKKYINLDELKTELNTEDPLYLDYLKNNKVKFSNGNTVNLNNDNADNVIADLAKRIYYTRNALVHSKEMEMSKYKPFHDDKELQKEIPLISCIAEQIILKNSVEL